MAFDSFFDDQFQSNPLVEMGNDVAENSPFNGGSIFDLNICGDFSTLAYTGGIEGEKILSFLKKRENVHFDWNDFITEQGRIDEYNLAVVQRNSTYVAPIIIPNYVYEPVFKQGILNKRICYIDYDPFFSVAINLKETTMSFGIYYKYKGADHTDFTVDYGSISSVDGTTLVALPNQYRAITLSTGSVEVFDYNLKELGLEDVRASLLDYIQLRQYQLNEQNLAQVNWFYSSLPLSVVQQLDRDMLWIHLRTLLQYDHSKWFVDNSGEMIKVIQAIAAQEGGAVYLYDKFYKEEDGKFLKDIYEHLDGSENYEGEVQERQSIFASILVALTYAALESDEVEFETVSTFTFDETHRVDSNVVFADRFAGRFNLTQEEEITYTYHKRWGTGEGTYWQTEAGRETEYLHPLALVQVTIPFNEEESITLPFPAIMVKDMARTQEWERIDAILRVGFNVLAIIGGIAALATSGNPLVLMAAVADIGLAATDLVVQAYRDELMKTEEGKAFLEGWEKVYTIGGLALAVFSAPELLRSIATTGARLIVKAVGATRNFIKSVLISIILEVNIARASKTVFKSVDIGAEAMKGVKTVAFNTKNVQRLEEQGVVFVRMVDESGVESYAAVYKGETIVPQGSAKQLRQELQGVLGKQGDDLVDALDEITILKQFDYLEKIPMKPPGGMGYLNGARLNRAQVRSWIKKIKKISKGEASLKIVEEGATILKGNRAGFNPYTKEVVLQIGMTEYEIFHEFKHLEEFSIIGQSKYVEGMIGSPAAKLSRTYKREKYVFDAIMEQAHKFNKAEISHAQNYMNSIIEKCEKSGIDITKL